MKRTALFLAVCFLFAATAPLLLGDVIDLVALKKQEEERRKKLGKSKAKITNDNVNTVVVGGGRYGYVQMEPDESAAEDAGPGQAGAPKQDDVTKQPDFWKKQQVDLEQRISSLKAYIERGQSDLNRLWSDFYIKNIAAEQEAIRAQIAQLTNQIEQKKLFLSQSEIQLEELYEKARKAGVPPGWLR